MQPTITIRVRDSRHEWPFPAIDEASREHDTWVSVSEENADYFRDCLPPIYFRGGFFVGEPHSHTSNDEPVHTAFICIADAILARHLPIKQGERAYIDLSNAIIAGTVEVIA